MASQILLTYYLHGQSLNLVVFSNNAAMETDSSANFFVFWSIGLLEKALPTYCRRSDNLRSPWSSNEEK